VAACGDHEDLTAPQWSDHATTVHNRGVTRFAAQLALATFAMLVAHGASAASQQPVPIGPQPAPIGPQPAPTGPFGPQPAQPAPQPAQPAPTTPQPAPTAPQPAPTAPQPAPTAPQPAQPAPQPAQPAPQPAQPAQPAAPAVQADDDDQSTSGYDDAVPQQASTTPQRNLPPDDGTKAIRRPNLTVARIFRGPFSTSRLFSMPTADVIGAYMLTLSGDASLLQSNGILTSGGVLAVGFGDVAQLEYRHSAAISITGINAPLPAVGLQLKIPLAERKNVPAFGVAFRLGVPRTEKLGDTEIEETVTDLYLVGRLRFSFAPWLTLHGGARYSRAKIELFGDREGTENSVANRGVALPTGGWEIAMNKDAKLVGELAFAPRFKFMPGPDTQPEIGYGMLGRLGLRWSVTPSFILDGSISYQTELGQITDAASIDQIVHWDIRLGAEVFVPWGALACRAVGVFCD
jgi:hypothetical protein